ncbi:MAG: acylneuraminate cytidylyltransferase [Chloroflexota bacterium]
MTEVLALIPARGGSKGIPRKNIRSFAGYPLMAYSIAAGLQAQTVGRVVVSTDDEEIAAVGREFGAQVPFLRPAELATDDVADLPAFRHALEWLDKNEGYMPDVVIQLRPTSPIRPPDLIDNAVRQLLAHADADSVRGVVLAGQNPHKMWRLTDDESAMRPLLEVEGLPEPYNAPRQALPQIYWQTGHVDAIRAQTILGKRSMSGDRIYPLLIDPRYTVDIDNLADWARYESLVYSASLEIVLPGRRRRPMPERIDLIVTDFDGVITDNQVWTDEQGKEAVVASRSDSMHIRELRERGIDVVILSSEPNPVVKARAAKMGDVEAVHGIDNRGKGAALQELLSRKHVDAAHLAYIGNDLNDLPCFDVAGWSVAVADAYPQVLRRADYVLKRQGGHGALRELCDLVLLRLRTKAASDEESSK